MFCSIRAAPGDFCSVTIVEHARLGPGNHDHTDDLLAVIDCDAEFPTPWGLVVPVMPGNE
jgi:hypothetical protein